MIDIINYINMSTYITNILISALVTLLFSYFIFKKKYADLENFKEYLKEVNKADKELIKDLEKQILIQNKMYAGLYSINTGTLKITPVLNELIIKRDALKREYSRLNSVDHGGWFNSKQRSDFLSLDIMIKEKSKEIIDMISEELFDKNVLK